MDSLAWLPPKFLITVVCTLRGNHSQNMPCGANHGRFSLASAKISDSCVLHDVRKSSAKHTMRGKPWSIYFRRG